MGQKWGLYYYNSEILVGKLPLCPLVPTPLQGRLKGWGQEMEMNSFLSWLAVTLFKDLGFLRVPWGSLGFVYKWKRV